MLALLFGCLVGADGAQHAEPEIPLADGFDYAVGAPDGDGYYDAQPFGENHHLGEDWNGVGGGDTDLGDPVTAVAAGRVTWAGHAGPGWGKVVRVAHRYREGGRERSVESMYAHLDAIEVELGQVVSRRDRIGTIGNADGRYHAHLHFEMRERLDLGAGPGYAADARGWISPNDFIDAHRPVR
jgi:murein DD-endopeptidase MepM/ murein hydrolase activator NlpD